MVKEIWKGEELAMRVNGIALCIPAHVKESFGCGPTPAGTQQAKPRRLSSFSLSTSQGSCAWQQLQPYVLHTMDEYWFLGTPAYLEQRSARPQAQGSPADPPGVGRAQHGWPSLLAGLLPRPRRQRAHAVEVSAESLI